jgi:hypothetical protein
MWQQSCVPNQELLALLDLHPLAGLLLSVTAE